ncbi:adenylate/guanylate cyclase domain-containing protein [Sphingosinicella sp. LHD-64]|uniref:adenylate/guanylate cyclase domain-containing protein n=1 Tax=Sphingosinicella sp. LHD-64 TaxID=3072139 RepID=UPI00280D30C0|nr:adenylate/guanylate cyclase domain-containing protein [Sphingosinicella sp. LHD-64]MDQ8755371.1 adenylate/guanylate cyclase domain-containing protein [Sphingosinicella sp. LHD-64]
MPETGNGSGWTERLRRNLRQIGAVRLLLTLLFLVAGIYLARFGWEVPLASDAERALYDLRFDREAERVLQQDDRIVLVTYNDDTLAELGKRSPLDRAMLAQALTAIDGMGPRAIGIDILIDQAQPEDDELIVAMRNMRTPTFLAFASARHNPDQILPWQEEFLTDFLRQVSSGPVRPASIRLETDLADGVIRRWPGQPDGLPPLLARAMAPGHPAFGQYRGAIDFRVPGTAESDEVPVFTNLPIQFVAQFPDGVRDMIAGRYVLIGGDIQDLDNYETPMTRVTGNWTKGLEVHAQILAQMLDGRMPAPIRPWALWLAAIGVVAAGALTSLIEARGWKLALALAAQIAFFGYFPFYLQQSGIDTLTLPAFGWGAGWLLAFIGVGTAARAVGSEQRRFAQSALGKYLPADVAAQIMRDPSRLALTGEKKHIYTLFTDLEGFTKLSHAITPEQLSSLLNTYLDRMSDVVLKHGGTIDKFVGDAVVAFWGAPIARPDDADRAVRAAIEMYEEGNLFSEEGGEDLPPIGITRVGLHYGEAVVGNFGGEGRIQYTALGDGMNTAARLESANKALKTTALISSEARNQASIDVFRPMGRIVLSGRATPVEVWEPVPKMEENLRARLVALWQRFDGGDTEALVQLSAIADEHNQDAALLEFIYRIREAGPGGHYVLGSK